MRRLEPTTRLGVVGLIVAVIVGVLVYMVAPVPTRPFTEKIVARVVYGGDPPFNFTSLVASDGSWCSGAGAAFPNAEVGDPYICRWRK